MLLAPSALNIHNLGDAMVMSQQGHPAWVQTCVSCINRIDGKG